MGMFVFNSIKLKCNPIVNITSEKDESQVTLVF